jgi:hypothetical protein
MRRAILSLPVLRLVLGVLVCLPASAPTIPYYLYENVLGFEKHWDIFVRDLYGCNRVGETTLETCKPTQGSINYREWSGARRAAMKLFELGEKE